MSTYTIAFIIVTILLLIGLGLFGMVVNKIDKWIDKRERLGTQSIYRNEKKQPSAKSNITVKKY